jgi:hypothetical protein
MVPKDPIRKIEDLISGQSRDNTYHTVCKKLKLIKDYKKELEYVYKRVSEVAPETRPSLEKLLDRMKKLDYSLISKDIKSEYGYLICPLTEIFYYGILKGIDSTVYNKQENINNLKTALEYLAYGDILERFFKDYLKRVEEKLHNKTGYTILELLEIGYKILESLHIKGIKNPDRNIIYFLNKKLKNVTNYLDTLIDLAREESKKVTDIVEDLVKHPEEYKKGFLKNI